MKTISALFVTLAFALAAAPAAAEDTYQSTMSGTVAIKVVPKPSADTEGQAGNQAGSQAEDTLTIQFVKTPREEKKDDDDLQRKLARCGRSWNVGLQKYETRKQVSAQIKSTLGSSNDTRITASPPKATPPSASRPAPATPRDAAPSEANAPNSARPKTSPVSDDGSQIADIRTLSRLDYRLCMYRCLGDTNSACPLDMTATP